MKKLYLSLGFALSLILSLQSSAEESKEEKNPHPKGQAVNFNATDVWNLDIFEREDHKVLVIQDRKYNKAKRLELGLEAGNFAASPFYTTWNYGARTAYHFTEYLGIEGIFNLSSSSFNKHGTQINEFLSSRSFTSTKEFREPKWYSGLGFVWSPIYGKFAFFRSNIIHYDFFATIGASVLKTNTNVTVANGGSNQTHVGSLLGLGLKVFLSKSWAFRFDTRQVIYQAKFAPTSPNGQGTDVTLYNYQFMGGFSYLINLGGF